MMLTAVANRNVTGSWMRGIRNAEVSQDVEFGHEGSAPLAVQNDLAKPEAIDCDEPRSFLSILLSVLGTLPA